MTMIDFEAAVLVIEHAPLARFHGAKSSKLIELAELALGVAFPPTYRLFLQRFGCGHTQGKEFFGLVSEDFQNSSIPDAIWLTLRERQMFQSTPKSLVFVADTGDGGYYAIETSSRNDAGESPVIEWWPGLPHAEGNGRVVSADFGEFLLKRLKGEL